MLGLCGDVSDNIPGVPGIGPKTAAKLLASYGDIDNLLNHTDELKGKQKEQLESFSEQAKLSKELATINTQVPVIYNWEEYTLNNPSQEQLESLFSELEFRTLGRRLFGESFQIKKESEDNFTLQSESILRPHLRLSKLNCFLKAPIVSKHLKIYRLNIFNKTQKKKEALAQAIEESQLFAFDTETNSLNTQCTT